MTVLAGNRVTENVIAIYGIFQIDAYRYTDVITHAHAYVNCFYESYRFGSDYRYGNN